MTHFKIIVIVYQICHVGMYSIGATLMGNGPQSGIKM